MKNNTLKSSIFSKKENILLLAPHCDDIEFSCGATVSRLVGDGHNVRVAVFSFCEDSVPKHLDKNILRKEMPKAMMHLGISKENIIEYDYPVRRFPAYRQEILENMVLINKDYSPSLVILPCSQDIHQDHHTIYCEGLRAFKKSKIIGYEMHWNNLMFNGRLFFTIKEENIIAKIKSISEYKSQLFRGLSDEDTFRSLAKIRGSQIGVKYAEAFEVIRWII